MFQSLIEVTDHSTNNQVLLAAHKIMIVMPTPEVERLSAGKCIIMLENGIRISVSESLEEVKALIFPARH